MARLVPAQRLLERGSLSLHLRPPVTRRDSGALNVQRMFLLLAPQGSPFQRLIAIARMRMPRRQPLERLWGFVDLVLAPADMQTALGPQVFATAADGVRHLRAAREFGRSAYELVLRGGHAHLRWDLGGGLEKVDPGGAADYLVTVANPDPAAWGLDQWPDLQGEIFDDLEFHVPVPTAFPPEVQARFRGRRFAPLDSVEWLDRPGAELLFTCAGTSGTPSVLSRDSGRRDDDRERAATTHLPSARTRST